MTELKNPGTAEATGDAICIACSYVGDIETFPPAMSVYQDIRCPKCGSTNNEHNSEYQMRLMQRMKKSTITPMNELQANHPDSEDIGPIDLQFKRDETHIYLEFGKQVEWLRLTPDVARSTARQLVMLAVEIDGEQTQRKGKA